MTCPSEPVNEHVSRHTFSIEELLESAAVHCPFATAALDESYALSYSLGRDWRKCVTEERLHDPANDRCNHTYIH